MGRRTINLKKIVEQEISIEQVEQAIKNWYIAKQYNDNTNTWFIINIESKYKEKIATIKNCSSKASLPDVEIVSQTYQELFLKILSNYSFFIDGMGDYQPVKYPREEDIYVLDFSASLKKSSSLNPNLYSFEQKDNK